MRIQKALVNSKVLVLIYLTGSILKKILMKKLLKKQVFLIGDFQIFNLCLQGVLG
jgi:hypothetical protein